MVRRTKDEAEVTRKNLLRAALIVFSRQGYADTRLEEIAAEANVTRGAIYHHFGSKAELYNTLVTESALRIAPLIEDAVEEGGHARDILRRLLTRTLEYAVRDPEYRAISELVAFKTALSPELEAGWQRKIEGMRGFVAFIADIVRGGIESGDLRADLEPEAVAFALMAYQNGVLLQWLIDTEGFHVAGQIEAFADIFIRGITAD